MGISGFANTAAAALKRRLVDLTRSVHTCKGYSLDVKGKQLLYQFLIDENIIADTETLEDLNTERLSQAVRKLESRHR